VPAIVPATTRHLLGTPRPSHNSKMIRRGDHLILTLGGVVDIPVIAVTDEKKENVRIRRGATNTVHVKNVEPDPRVSARRRPDALDGGRPASTLPTPTLRRHVSGCPKARGGQLAPAWRLRWRSGG